MEEMCKFDNSQKIIILRSAGIVPAIFVKRSWTEAVAD